MDYSAEIAHINIWPKNQMWFSSIYKFWKRRNIGGNYRTQRTETALTEKLLKIVIKFEDLCDL